MPSSDVQDPPPEFPEPATLAQPLADHIVGNALIGTQPVVVAIDGRSGSGKSTLADVLVASLRAEHGIEAVVIGGDDFYAGRSAASWDALSPAENADLVFDWQRQRSALESLRNNTPASWFPFDWAAPDWDSDTPPISEELVTCAVADVVVLEGVYSARPELHDVLDVRVLLDTPPDQRRRQLEQREGDAHDDRWARRWSAAEDHYIENVMTVHDYDIVL